MFGHKCSESDESECFHTEEGQYLNDEIYAITGIASRYLAHPQAIYSTSVARRMSWAAKRETTRPEDVAYSLLGIFNVHMPLLYGEGTRAFMRLQEDIIRTSDDDSVLAWTRPPTYVGASYGLLATSPSMFADSGVVRRRPRRSGRNRSSLALTNKGLNILSTANMSFYPAVGDHGVYVIELDCGYSRTSFLYQLDDFTTSCLGLESVRLHPGPDYHIHCKIALEESPSGDISRVHTYDLGARVDSECQEHRARAVQDRIFVARVHDMNPIEYLDEDV